MEINKFYCSKGSPTWSRNLIGPYTTFGQQIQLCSPDHFLLGGACNVSTRLCSTAVSSMCSSDFLINACYTWFLFLKIAPTSLKHVQCQEVPSIPKKLCQHIWHRPTVKPP